MSAAHAATPNPRSAKVASSGRRFALFAAAALAACLVPLATAPAADAATAWGSTGATYSGGILCQLSGGTSVPLTSWVVDDVPAFATADVVKTGVGYGPAPTTGASAPIAPGQAGLDATSIAAAAYLIAHHGSGSARDVAETSAEIARAAGAGTNQQRCLGQQGTNSAHAQSLWASAERYAGPYTVRLGATPHAKPLSTATVTATVFSASGVPTPGIAVTFDTNIGDSTATTGHDGVARAQITMPSVATTPIRATASAPVSLTYFATNPPAVTVAAPAIFSGTGTVSPVLHPRPTVSVAAGHQLLLANGTTPVSASIGGTYGYTGTGTVTVVGPVRPTAGTTCSALSADAFANAATAWTGTFAFTGDGARPAGVTSPLRPGCYATKAALETSDSVPPVRATSGLDAAGTVTVSTLQLTTSTGSGIAPPGPLQADVAAVDAGSAKVSSTVTAYGPIVTHDGQCDSTLKWSSAPVAGTTTDVDLTPLSQPSGTTTTAPTTGQAVPRSGDVSLTGQVSTERVSRLGCYAFATRSTVTQDGKTLVVDTPVGAKGATTLVMRPQLQVTDGTYGAQQGASMTGQVTVVGAYKYAGRIRVGLQSGRPTATGCRTVRFDGNQPTTTTVRVTGDGDFAFRTPVAAHNVCYAVTAALALDANPAVQALSPRPTSASVFLAGVELRDATSDPLPHPRADGMFRPLVAAVGAGIVMLIVAVAAIGVGVAARAARRSDIGWTGGSVFTAH